MCIEPCRYAPTCRSIDQNPSWIVLKAKFDNCFNNCCIKVGDPLCCDYLCNRIEICHIGNTEKYATRFLSLMLLIASLMIFYQRFVGFYLVWRAFLFVCDINTQQPVCEEIKQKIRDKLPQNV